MLSYLEMEAYCVKIKNSTTKVIKLHVPHITNICALCFPLGNVGHAPTKL